MINSNVVPLLPIDSSFGVGGKYDRREKNEAREFIFMDLSPKQSIITLPSDGALCSQALVREGVIDSDTVQQWVEREPDVYRRLPKLAKHLGYQNVQTTNCLLENYVPTTKVDLINADMECSFTEKLGLAFERVFSEHLLPDASIILWLTEWSRNPATRDFHEWFENKVHRSDPNDPLRREGDRISHVMGNQMPNMSVVLPLLLMSCALNRFAFDIMDSRGYADTRFGMVVMGLNRIRPRESMPNLPLFSSLVAEFRDQHQRIYLTRAQCDTLAWLEERLARQNMGLRFSEDYWWTLCSGTPTGGKFTTIEQVYDTFRGLLS